MPQIMNDTSYSAEYYLEYEIERVGGDRERVKTPKIYFERDGKSELLTYSLYTVPEEWVMKTDSNGARKRPVPDYDTVRVLFDINGVDCSVLNMDNQRIEVKNVITFDQFYRDGCRVMIENSGSRDHSGVGMIEMMDKGVSVAKFLFSINFVHKRKIAYTIELRGRQAYLEFKCKDQPTDIPVRLVYSAGRLPCLKNDMAINVIRDFVLDFEKSDTFKTVIDLPPPAMQPRTILSATIVDERLSRFYVLDCKRNRTLHIRGNENINTDVSYTCPFCHQTIGGNLASNSRYQKGGVDCQAADVAGNVKGSKAPENNQSLPTIYTKNNARAKRCLYCSKDLTKDGKFRPNFTRLLPNAFLEHDNFKIAMAGSKRAGKTTYISRFFDLSGQSPINMPMATMGNRLRNFGINVQVASLPKVRLLVDSTYVVDDADWCSDQKQYTERSINLDPPSFPGETTTGDYTSYPFIAEVNKRSYVSFYDIAGEDAEHTMQVQNIANGEPIGVFCIINGKVDRDANNGVISMLRNANLSARSPIAVIVTKMDMLEADFDVNCQCLRTDYFDGSTTYEGSALERHIDYSSEEIRSYLMQMDLLPNFGGNYRNVKFFGVSAFDFFDSIHESGENVNDPGKVRFECSSKRIELPFIWMLKQFGVIK